MLVPFLFASPLQQFLELFGLPHWSLIEFHEASTHFPIGLLLAAVAFDFGALVTRKKMWHDVAFWMQMLGTFALLVTLASGYFGNTYHGANDEGQKATWHQNFAFVTTGLFLCLAVWRVARQRKIGRVETGIYALVTLSAVAVISITGWMGSQIGG
ncbi:hypothetical protein IAD21_06073 [Abditibacteriota bacterium]|nr:hypothetical protein IAD21_06073 [Abditibacteriota bacterium]